MRGEVVERRLRFASFLIYPIEKCVEPIWVDHLKFATIQFIESFFCQTREFQKLQLITRLPGIRFIDGFGRSTGHDSNPQVKMNPILSDTPPGP